MRAFKRAIPFLCCLVLSLCAAVCCNAAAGAYDELFSVTVPSSVAISVDEQGAVHAANFVVENHSAGAVRVSALSVETASGWTLKPSGTSFYVNERSFSISINGDDMADGFNAAALSAVGVGQTQTLPVSAEVAVQSSNYSGTVGSIVFVIGWDGDGPLADLEIATPPTKTAYKAGNAFDASGMVVKAIYATGVKKVVAGYTVSPATLAYGNTAVTVSYTEGGRTATATQAVSVTKTKVATPTAASSLTYNGGSQTQTFNQEPSASIATKGGTTSATDAGSYTTTFTLKNTALYEWESGFNGSVTWSIAKKALTVTAAAQTVTYGTAITKTAAKATASALADGDALDSVTLTQSTTNVTTNGTITPSAAVIKDGSTDVTGNYTISYATGVLKINQKALTVTAKAQTITYGGSIATGTAQATASGLVSGDTFSGVTLTASTANAGSGTITPSAAVVKRSNTTVTGNYNITYATGTLTINKANSSVTTAPTAKTLTYSGSAQALVNAGAASGGTMNYSTDNSTWSESVPTGTNAGSYTVYYKVVGDSNHNDNAGSSVSVSIAKATPTVTAPTKKTLTYSGGAQALVNAGSTTGGTLNYSLDNSSWSASIPTGTNATSYTVYYKVVGNANYNAVDAASVSASIGKKALTVTAKAQTVTYGGSIATGTAQVTASGLVSGDALNSVTLTASTANAGTGTITPSAAVVKRSSATVTGNYNITYATGTLTINKAASSVTTAPTAKTLTYSGSAQALVNAGAASGGTMKYSTDNNTWSESVPSGTNATSYTVYYKVVGDANHNDTDAASVSASIGKKALTVTAKAQTITYGGSIATGTAQATASGLVSGDTFSGVTLTASTANAGSGTITPSAAVVKRSNTTVTGNYNITYATGTLTINKANSSVTTAPTAKTLTYSGSAQALVNAGAASGGTMNYSTDNSTWSETVPSGTNATSYTVYYKVVGDANHNDTDAANVSASIGKKALTITAKAQTVTYGTAITTGTAQATASGLVSGDALNSVTLTASTANAGTGTITPSAAVVKRSSATVTSNYSITYNTGALTINKAASSVTTAPTAKTLTYSGSAQALVNAGAASGGTMHYSTDNSTWSESVPTGTNAGSYTVYYKVVGDSNHNDNAGSSVSVSIAKATPTVTAPTKKTLTYNGGAQALVNAGAASGGTMNYSTDNSTWSESIPSGTNATSYTVYYKVVGDANYNAVDAASVSASIGKKALTVTAKAQTVTYGTAITTGTAQVTASGLVSGDALNSVTLTASRTDVGSGTITASAAVVKRSSTTVTSNYSITYKTGTLTVSQKALTITASAQTVTYGTAITTGTGKVTASGLVNSDTLDSVTLTASTTNVTTNGTITPSAAVVKHSGTDVTGNYSITYNTGVLKINQKALTVTAKAQTVTYGTAITKTTAQVTVSGLVSGDALNSVTLTQSTTSVTTSGTITPSAAVVKRSNTDVTGNYSITYNTGALTITAKALTVTAKAQTITYGNSIATGAAQATASGLASGDALSGVTLTASRTDAGSGTITPSAAVVKNGNTDVTSNYTITYATGTLTINKANSSVTTAPTAKTLTYSGSAQALVNAGAASGGTLKYSADNSTWNTTIPTGTNAGSYTVYYKVFGDANHNDTTAVSVSVSIAKKSLSGVTVSISGYAYGASKSTPSVTSNPGNGTVTYYGRATASGTATAWSNVTSTTYDVGTRYCYAVIAETANYNAFTTGNTSFAVSKGTLSGVTVSIAGYTYGGTKSTPSLSGTYPSGTVSYYGRADANGTATAWGSVTNTTYNAGTRYCYATITGMTNYNDYTTANKAFTVNKATISATITVSIGTYAYGASKSTPTISSNPYSGTVTFYGRATAGGTATAWSNVTSTTYDVGTRYCYATITGMTNYNNYTTADKDFVITKGSIAGAAVTISGYTYGGTKSTPSVTGNLGGGAVTYYGRADANGTATAWSSVSSTTYNAGTRYCYAVIAETTNYNGYTTANKSFTVAKATISDTLTVNIAGYTYGGTKSTPTISANPHGGTVTFYGRAASGGTATAWGSVTNTTYGAGTRYCYATVTGMTNYNDYTTAEKSFAIAKATPSVTAPTKAANMTYNGSARDLTATAGSTNFGTLQYSTDNSTWSTTRPKATNAGTYTVYYRVAGNDNVNAVASVSLGSVTIAQKAPTLSASATSVTLYVDALTATSTITTDGDGALSVSSSNTSVATASISNKVVTISHVNKTAGTATITVTLAAGTNYSGKTLTIAVNARFFAWTLSNGTLTLSGLGAAMPNYASGGAPWYSSRSSITNIVIQDGLTNIGDFAFISCSNVTTATIPAGVTTIGQFAFQHCGNLTTCTLPSSLVSISDGAFWGTKFTSVTIPASVTTINSGAFASCPSLTSFSVAGGNSFCVVDGVLFNKAKTRLVHYPTGRTDTSYTVPTGVTSIQSRAFFGNTTLTSVLVQSGVTNIEYYAFYSCSKLKTLTLPSTLTAIGNDVCKNSALTDVYYDSTQANWNAISKGSNAKLTGATLHCWLANGTCGTAATWVLYNDYALYIYGTGAMTDYASGGAPWYASYRTNIVKLVVANGVTSIGQYALQGCTAMTSATLPSSVTALKNYAFDGCSILAATTLPGSLTSLGWCAFRNCTKLTTTIPSSVTFIDQWAFQACTSLTSAAIPSGVTSLSDNTFYGCTGLTSVTFPSALTGIGYRAFYGCTGLTSITIPSTVTTLGAQAFDSCSGLRTVSVSSGTITNNAFQYCTALTNLTIGNTVTNIGHDAFRGCTALTSATIPASVTSIGYAPFAICTALTSITVNASNANYCAVDGVLFNKAKTELIQYPAGRSGKYVVPAGVTTIGQQAFDNALTLTAVSLPDSLTTIGVYGFSGCTTLTTVHLGSGVTTVKEHAFNACTVLATVYYNGTSAMRSSISITSTNNGKFTGATWRYRNTNGTCGANAFWVLYDDGTLYIYGTGAMSNWDPNTNVPWYNYRTSITKVIVEKGVTSIGNKAFEGTYTALQSFDLPDGLTYIGWRSIYGCTALTTLSIPNTVNEFGSSACANNTALTATNIPTSMTSVNNWAFSGCTNLTAITIPAGVVTLGTDVFNGCTKLATVTFAGNSLTTIGNNAFKDCKALKTITLPSNLVTIGANAFRTSGLTAITIPSKVTTIGDCAFYYAALSGTVTIPASVTAVYGTSFAGNAGLTSISVNASNANYSAQDGVLFNKDKTTIICYPAGKTDVAYIIPPTVTSSFSYSFSRSVNLKMVALSDGMTAVPMGMFQDCTGLKSVVLPSGLNSVVNWGFAQCNALTDVYFKSTEADWTNNVVPNIGATSNNKLTSATKHYHIASGSCGGIKRLYSAGVYEYGAYYIVCDNSTRLYIYGTSAIQDYAETTAPWYADYRTTVTSLVVEVGITTLGKHAFRNFTVMTAPSLPDTLTGIKDYAFSGSKLPSITIPNSVTGTIGYGAFQDCDAMTTVVVGNGVTALGTRAFMRCGAITSLTLGSSVTSIGRYAISKCYALKSITIPNSVTSLVQEAFRWDHALETVNGGSGLQSIAYMAFENCDKLKSISIPSATTIGESAFQNCKVMTSITFGNSLTTIGALAFSSCNKLASITIPSSVTSLGSQAFKWCSTLTSVTIPATLTTISNGPFACCTKLTSITVDANNPNYCSVNGVLFNKAKTQLVQYPVGSSATMYVVPSTVTSLNDRAFDTCAALKTLVIPNIVTNVEDCTFASNNALTDVYFLGTQAQWNITVSADGNDKFTNATKHYLSSGGSCNSDTWWALFDSNTFLLIYGAGAMPNYASGGAPWYANRATIAKIVTADGVTSIGNYAFQQCAATTVTFASTLTTVGQYAFDHCTALTSASIPNSVTSVGGFAFYYCSALTSVTVPSGLTVINNCLLEGCPITSFTIPSNVTSIGNYAFKGTRLTSISIPNKVTSIGLQAFYNCTALTSITIPNSVTSIGNQAFYGCTAATSLTFTATSKVATIGVGAFQNCSKLTSITIPNSVTSIGNTAFQGCSLVTTLTFAGTSKVATIGDSAFRSMTKLTAANIPNSVTTIGVYAFYDDTALTTASVGSGVTSFGNGVFGRCTALKSITLNASNTAYCVEEGVLFNKAKTTLVEYPAGKTATIYAVPHGVTTISPYAFIKNTALKTLVMESSVTNIGTYAFYQCAMTNVYYTASSRNGVTIAANNDPLTSATWHYATSDTGECGVNGNNLHWMLFNDKLLFIYGTGRMPESDDWDIYWCQNIVTNAAEGLCAPWINEGHTTSIKTVVIGSGVTDVGGCAFYGCTALTAVSIASTVTFIDNQAFYGCTALTSVNIPGSVTEIYYGFEDCTALAHVYYGGTQAQWNQFASHSGVRSGATMHYNASW